MGCLTYLKHNFIITNYEMSWLELIIIVNGNLLLASAKTKQRAQFLLHTRDPQNGRGKKGMAVKYKSPVLKDLKTNIRNKHCIIGRMISLFFRVVLTWQHQPRRSQPEFGWGIPSWSHRFRWGILHNRIQ